MTALPALEKKVIALYVDTTREHARSIASRVAGDFRAGGFDVVDVAAAPAAALLVTVGGDGTLLRAARVAVEARSPTARRQHRPLGILTELDEDDPRLSDLPSLVARGLFIDERTALEAEYDGERYFALNDVVVRKGEFSRIVPFGLRVDDGAVTRIAADGICVATPTGSTAYFLSAGGSLIAPSVEAFGVVPLLPHTLFSRPLDRADGIAYRDHQRRGERASPLGVRRRRGQRGCPKFLRRDSAPPQARPLRAHGAAAFLGTFGSQDAVGRFFQRSAPLRSRSCCAGCEIEDYGLIARADVEFADGATIFTGETGSGKTMLLGALEFALGARAGSDVVRRGARKASVTVTFEPDETLRARLAEDGFELDDGEAGSIAREVNECGTLDACASTGARRRRRTRARSATRSPRSSASTKRNDCSRRAIISNCSTGSPARKRCGSATQVAGAHARLERSARSTRAARDRGRCRATTLRRRAHLRCAKSTKPSWSRARSSA